MSQIWIHLKEINKNIDNSIYSSINTISNYTLSFNIDDIDKSILNNENIYYHGKTDNNLYIFTNNGTGFNKNLYILNKTHFNQFFEIKGGNRKYIIKYKV